MLETLNTINWKQLDKEADHNYIFLHNWGKSYADIPDFLEELASGVANEEFAEAMFGEMDSDFDAKLFEAVLPFLWEIVLEAEPEAVNFALVQIDEGFLRFYSMESERMPLDFRVQGISKLPAPLIGNNPVAAFAKLKAVISTTDDPEIYSSAINILSFIPDYHSETISFFQSLLGKASSTKDEVILSALGRLLSRYKLPITGDFERYLDKSGSVIQTMAASWVMQIAPSQANDYTKSLYDHRDLMLTASFPANLERWYELDYQD